MTTHHVSQVYRFVRLFVAALGAHVVFPHNTPAVAAIVGALEVAFRQVSRVEPSGR